ncbi:hypothetical protein TIFTF001_038049 [Ficus carica]|uniref:Retrotransposon gag domain-containing protein n=1 Tax=Ficus carica TaxID=3494 RepID=A0AA88EHX2_FICCA|nr:hypothetical protein TIFTF001_038049 [Ficus carica]
MGIVRQSDYLLQKKAGTLFRDIILIGKTPWVLMEWIHNVEVGFQVCDVRHQLHVDLATMRLRGHALIWWLSVPKRHILNWPQILEMLRDEFELPPYKATVE